MALRIDSPVPGNLTVPPLFDWDVLASVVGLVAVLAVVALVALSARPGASSRAEWQQWLDARSRVAPDPEDLRAER